MVNQQKQTIVGEILQKVQENTNFILIKFEKTSHISLELLRKELRQSQSTIKISKNTLLEKTFSKLSRKGNIFDTIRKSMFPLKDNSALVTLKVDYTDALKAFYTFAKKEKTLSFKFGVLENKLYTSDELLRIAQLPGRSELIGKIIGSFKSPSSRFVRSLTFATSKLVYVLKAQSEKTH